MRLETPVAEMEAPARKAAPPAQRDSSSWYLDPLTAAQKRRINLEVVREALYGLSAPPRVVLKTDLFEEANGPDQLLLDLDLGQEIAVGFDRCLATAGKAGRRAPSQPIFVSDARALALADASVDLIISTSTLDHMDDPADLERALAELGRVLRPGGRLALTLDNPWNPIYPLLRAVCALPGAPFTLGRTLSKRGLDSALRRVGLLPRSWRPIVHNPRLVSTLYFLLLRRLAGRRADWGIAHSLTFFDSLEKLPTRWLTGCFVAVCAEKPVR